MSGRAGIAACAALALAACTPTPPSADVSNLILVPGGMQQPGNPAVIAFGNDEPNILQLTVQITGDTPEGGSNDECGAGPMTFASFLDDLTLNFEDGAFVGWISTDPTIPIEGGLRPGQPAPPATDVTYSETTLGTEFAQGDGIYGILTEDGSQIRLMWAGTQCFFR
ncbi:hypothetical protein HKCCE3408_09625 [Rhodobacterales bacterium HKCCE3408]|nr:hypothetical protein [Rhodobacterales bacterium HKCCE3408]